MGNTLPKLGFHKTPTDDLLAAITDGAFRLLQWIRAYCWEGTPFVLPKSADITAHFADLLRTSERTIRNYIKQLTAAGLIEEKSSSRGWELYPVEITGATATQPSLDAESGKNLPKPDGKNLPKPQGKVGGDNSLYTYLPPISNKSKVAKSFDRKDGKNFPESWKKSSKTRPEFGKNLPKPPPVSTHPDSGVENAVDKSNLTPVEREYVERLEAVNLYGNNILRAVRKAIAQGISAGEFLAIAQTLLETLKAERGIENIHRTAAWRLANNRLVVPTERDRRREQHNAAKRRQRDELLAEIRASTG